MGVGPLQGTEVWAASAVGERVTNTVLARWPAPASRAGCACLPSGPLLLTALARLGLCGHWGVVGFLPGWGPPTWEGRALPGVGMVRPVEGAEEWVWAGWKRTEKASEMLFGVNWKATPFPHPIFIVEIATNTASVVLVAQRRQGSQCCEIALWECQAQHVHAYAGWQVGARGGFGMVPVKASGLELGARGWGQAQTPSSVGGWALDPCLSCGNAGAETWVESTASL